MKLPGWRKLAPGVYEHADTTRMHLGGLIKWPNTQRRFVDSWPESAEVNKAIAICGGNRKRGMMYCAVKNNPDNQQRVSQ